MYGCIVTYAQLMHVGSLTRCIIFICTISLYYCISADIRIHADIHYYMMITNMPIVLPVFQS